MKLPDMLLAGFILLVDQNVSTSIHIADGTNSTANKTVSLVSHPVQDVHRCSASCSVTNITQDETAECRDVTCTRCPCDEDCGGYRDCCNNTGNRREKCPVPYECVLSRRYSYHFSGKYDGYYMKTACPGYIEGSSASPTFPADTVSPVTSLITNITYISESIAFCHNDSLVVKWEKTNRCSERKKEGSNTDDYCIFQIHRPLDLLVCGCRDMYLGNSEYIHTCSSASVLSTSTRDLEAEHDCRTLPYRPVSVDEVLFRNIHCYMCNELAPHASACTRSSPSSICINRLVQTTCTKCRPVCKHTQWYDPIKNKCRYMICRQGSKLKDVKCVTNPVNLPSVRYHLRAVGRQVRLNTDVSQPLNWSSLESMIIQHIPVLLTYNISDLEFTLYNIASGDATTNSELNPSFGIHAVFSINQNCCRSEFEQQISKLLIDSWTVNHHGSQYVLYSTEDDLNSCRFNKSKKYKMTSSGIVPERTNMFKSTHDSEEIIYLPLTYPQCVFIILHADDFIQNAGTSITLSYAEITFQLQMFTAIRKDKLAICLDMLKMVYKDYESQVHLVAKAKTIVSIFFSILSLVCLTMTFITYCTFPSLLTLPTKNTMCLVVSLFVAQLLLQFMDLASRDETTCKVIGVLLHYSWLSVILWMNVCSYHMFHVFVMESGRPFNNHSHFSRLLCYFLYANGTSLIIVIVTITVNLAVTSGKQIGYGDGTCYLSTAFLTGVAYVLPLGIVLLINIIFFSITVWTMAKIKKMSAAIGQDKSQVHIYMKLSTLTGVFWTLSILAEHLQLQFLVFISIILNASQGVFIFFSNIANIRVYQLWKEKFSLESKADKNCNTKRTYSTHL